MPTQVEGLWVKGYSKSPSICANRADFAFSPVRRSPIDVCTRGSFITVLRSSCWTFGVFARITPVVGLYMGGIGAACGEPFCGDLRIEEALLGSFARAGFFGVSFNFKLLLGKFHGHHVYCEAIDDVCDGLLTAAIIFEVGFQLLWRLRGIEGAVAKFFGAGLELVSPVVFSFAFGRWQAVFKHEAI